MDTSNVPSLRREAEICAKADLPSFGEWAAYVRMLGKMLAGAADEIERLQEGYPGIAHDFEQCRQERDELRLQVESLQNKWASRPLDHPSGEALMRENDRLRAALERSPCPRPLDSDDGTAGDCFAKCHCGCENARLLGSAAEPGDQRENSPP